VSKYKSNSVFTVSHDPFAAVIVCLSEFAGSELMRSCVVL